MSTPTIEVTPHADRRMAERGITWKMVRQAVLKPERTQPSSHGQGRIEAISTYKGRRYRIVYSRPSPDKIVVHTGY